MSHALFVLIRSFWQSRGPAASAAFGFSGWQRASCQSILTRACARLVQLQLRRGSWLSVGFFGGRSRVQLQMVRTLLGFVFASFAKGQPTANLQLSPPENPLPQVSAIVANLESARQTIQEKDHALLQAAYDTALVNGRARIRKALDSSQASGWNVVSSFLANRAAKPGAVPGVDNVLLEMVPPSAPSGVIRGRIQRLDRVLASEDEAVLQQGCREMALLVDIVVGDLQHALDSEKDLQGSGGASFLASSDDLNIRVNALAPYPTIADIVAESELARFEAGNDLKHKILQSQLQLLQALNGFISASLNNCQ